MISSATNFTLVDSHVHYHTCFEPRDFWPGCFDNFAAARRCGGLLSTAADVLMLSECRGARWFEHWRDLESVQVEGVAVQPTGESCSLVVRRGEQRIVVIAGRQLITREKLEVLALATDRLFADGKSLSDTVDAVLAAGGVAVLPWGFGKWWFRRGRLLACWLGSAHCRDVLHRGGLLFAGDNGGRSTLSGTPRLLRETESGLRVLAGSDPLPFESHSRRAGSYGSRVPGRLGTEHPARQLKDALAELAGSPPLFGRRTHWAAFCRNQVQMQTRKLFPGVA